MAHKLCISELDQNRNPFEKSLLCYKTVLGLPGIIWLVFPLTFLSSSLKLFLVTKVTLEENLIEDILTEHFE